MEMQQRRVRIPKKGAIRYFAENCGTGLQTRRGEVVRVASTNAALRREYVGIIAPPAFVRAPHVLLRIDVRFTSWVPLERLYARRKDVDRIVVDATRMTSAARLGVEENW
jgi:Holliday junction resolvase